METQKAITVLRQYGQGELKGKKALAGALEAARSLPRSHNLTVVLRDIGRKAAGGKTSVELQQQVNAALAGLIGLVVPPETEKEPPDLPDPGNDETYYRGVDLNTMSYSKLQSMCKEAGLPGNGSKEDLIAMLTEADDAEAQNEAHQAEIEAEDSDQE